MNARTLALLLLCSAPAAAQAPSLTIYNGGFAVVRQPLKLDLKAGLNDAATTDITRSAEPQSVLLRDPERKLDFRILEQNYIGDPLQQERLLQLHEGKSIGFEATEGERKVVVQGRIVRAPYSPNPQGGARHPSQGYTQPIVEVDGKLRFSLPGQPLFPALDADAVLKPTLSWKLEAAKAGTAVVELGYVTGGLSWEADYNVVTPETGDKVDLIGWVTMENRSGKDFRQAAVSLMAGDVNKVAEPEMMDGGFAGRAMMMAKAAPAVTERTFDEYHLYTLARSVDLADRETKQVEFLRAAGASSKQVYIYDGAESSRFDGWSHEMIRGNPQYGTESNTKVKVFRELENTKAKGLGLALPKGKIRFYRQDGEQLQFTGENVIDHTPEGETLRIYTGDAFDLVGERKQTRYTIDTDAKTATESFEVKVRNRKKTAVEIRVFERLYRGLNWEIVQKTNPVEKKDAKTVEFPLAVPPDSEKVLTYTVRYSW